MTKGNNMTDNTQSAVLAAFEISPSQAVQLMSLAQLLREGDLVIRGDEDEDVEAAYALIADVAQEIALQVPQHIKETT
jgi:hypothetical protein